MPYYKDTDNNIHFIDSEEFESYLPFGLIRISDQEADYILAQKTQMQLDARTYAEKRASAYPSFTDYLDGIVKGDRAQVDKYIADCLAVKARFPKP